VRIWPCIATHINAKYSNKVGVFCIMRSSRESLRLLATLAQSQGGYFTAKQAAKIGYGYKHLDYHETVGNFQRIDHGLYRLPTIPLDENDELIRLTFWSRNQKDVPQGVISHQTALILHDLSELLPSEVHLTVPPKFRKETPSGVVLHKAILEPRDIEERTGFKVTTPLRTLIDAARSDVSLEQLEKAVTEALSRGLVRRQTLVDAINRQSGLDRLSNALPQRRRIVTN
jgi:predicted transcriptional regulator of viral defense system